MISLSSNRCAMPPWPGWALLQRDLLRSLRRVRPFIFLVVLIAVQLFVVVGFYPRAGQQLSAVGYAADQIFLWFTLVTLGAGGVLLPSAAALSVVTEREQETFDLVRLTLMRRGTFVLAKLGNAWGYYALFVIASMPLAAVIFFMVGLEVRQALFSGAILIMASLALTVIGVSVSCRARTSMGAILMAYGLGFVFMGGQDLLIMVLDTADLLPDPPNVSGLQAWIVAIAPPLAINAIHSGDFGIEVVWRAGVYNGFLSVAFAWWGWHGLVTWNNDIAGRRSRLGGGAIRPISDWQNPVAVKERRWSIGLQRRGTWMLRIFAVAYFLIVSMWSVGTMRSNDFSGFLACVFGFALLSLLVPIFVVNPLTREKDLLNLDMLRMTMLTSRQIVLGKIGVGARQFLLLVAALPLAYYTTAWLMGSRGTDWYKFLMGLVAGGACVFLFAGLSAWIATRSSRSATALTASYAAGFAVGIGLPLLGAVTLGLSGADGEFAAALGALFAPFIGWLIVWEQGDYLGFWLFGLVLFYSNGWLFFHKAIARYLLAEGASPADTYAAIDEKTVKEPTS